MKLEKVIKKYYGDKLNDNEITKMIDWGFEMVPRWMSVERLLKRKGIKPIEFIIV